MLRAKRAIFLVWPRTNLVHDVVLCRVLGAGYYRRLPMCCFACRNNVLDFSCVCDSMSLRSFDRADIGDSHV